MDKGTDSLGDSSRCEGYTTGSIMVDMKEGRTGWKVIYEMIEERKKRKAIVNNAEQETEEESE
ncbi:hypothetical protein NQ317_003041 [Molorchus minor]|uniref:Uncharacterized protein n=1 Tax=Molorchus minor TaxID=1323400 RepID=A0ABQ9JDY7_9CUCU|nr:hypothetical protein NQ317_003041 [Molorchus minor]